MSPHNIWYIRRKSDPKSSRGEQRIFLPPGKQGDFGDHFPEQRSRSRFADEAQIMDLVQNRSCLHRDDVGIVPYEQCSTVLRWAGVPTRPTASSFQMKKAARRRLFI